MSVSDKTTAGDTAVGLHDVAVAFGGNMTVTKLRTFLDADPQLKGMFTRLGRVFAIPSSRLPEVLERLRSGRTTPQA